MKCTRCEKEIELFSLIRKCADDDCDRIFCEKCVGSLLTECRKCNSLFCSLHLDDHECDSENEEGEVGELDILKEIKMFDEKQLLRLLVYSNYMSNENMEDKDWKKAINKIQGR